MEKITHTTLIAKCSKNFKWITRYNSIINLALEHLANRLQMLQVLLTPEQHDTFCIGEFVAVLS